MAVIKRKDRFFHLVRFKPPYGELIFRDFLPLGRMCVGRMPKGDFMKKDVNLKLLVLATGLILIAAVFFAACGPGAEPDQDPVPETAPVDPTYTVTFKNGSITYKTETRLKIGDSVTFPKNPTSLDYAGPDLPTTVGFYKLTTTNTPSFQGWSLTKNGTTTETSPYTVTGNQTFYAIWNNGGTWETTTLTGSGSTLAKVKSTIASPSANDYYALVLGPVETTETDFKTPMTINTAVAFDATNTKLIITSTSAGQRVIKSSVTSEVFLTIGPPNSIDNNTISVTLNAIVLEGTGTANDSLVRVQNGATLTLAIQSAVRGHKNSATSGSGTNGNGSAVCVFGANLNMKYGSVIEENESTGTSTNTNLVGGVYTIASDKGTKPEPHLIIEGGQIINNTCKTGQTKDVYATEGGSFILSGDVKIDEITLNGDASGTTAPFTNNDNALSATRAVITVSDLGKEANVKLSLRSTSNGIDVVKKVWTDNAVLIAPASGNLSSADVGKFTLKEFKCYNGTPTNQTISGYKISTDADKIGKLVTN